ncbi:hypothetical protein [Devosia sp. CN2-171]|uniref:hypothetical protein n=1 Tax=Devosia sp. CN2-171 TaxID=3400909 RepID=UPI003BF8FA95
MSDVATPRAPEVAKIDRLIDENAAPLEVPADSALRLTDDVEKTVGATGPTAWWRAGLVALGIVAAILLIFQLMMGGAGTDVAPGTPTTAPDQVQTPQ